MDRTENDNLRNNSESGNTGIPIDNRHYVDQAYRNDIQPVCTAAIRQLGDYTARLLHQVLVDRLGPSSAAEVMGAFDTQLDEANGSRETIEPAWDLYTERIAEHAAGHGPWDKTTFTINEANIDPGDDRLRTLAAEGRKVGVVLEVTTSGPDQQDSEIWLTGSVHDREALLREAHRIALAQLGQEVVWTSATNPWGGDTAQLITNALYIATYRRDLAPDKMWPAPTLRIRLDYWAAGRATSDPIAGPLADLIEIGPDGKVLVDILDPSDDLAPVQGRDVALVLQAVTDLRDDDNVIPGLLGHVAPNLSSDLNAVARAVVAAVHTTWPPAGRERAESILSRPVAELAAMISPVQGACPNDPPCEHPGFLHDIEDEGDPIPMCGHELCVCGQPPVGYRRSQPMRVWRDGQMVPAGQAVMNRAGQLVLADHGKDWLTMYPVVAVERRAIGVDTCKCVVSCAADPATMCSLSGEPHVHPDDGTGVFGRCPVHPDAPGDQ